MAKNPELIAHQEWLGYVQPIGLVVSTPALLAAQAYINKNIIPEHQRFLECVEPISVNGGEDTVMAVTDFPRFLQEVLDWQAADLISESSLESLEVVLPEYGETLRPTYAVREVEPDDAQGNPWIMLVQTLRNGVDLDAMKETDDHKWQASPHAHFERLLRETKVPIGLLFNGTHLRLVYAPRGETSGYLTFPVDAMAQVDGRPIFAGLHLLLSAERLFTLPRKQRLPYLLSESRKYQNLVSTQLSEQVLHSLYELLRGFQAADDTLHGELLRQVLKEDPNHVYAGLLNVLLRLVFVLYAEDRGLMPGDSVYGNFYSINGLFERLRSDASRFPDTMDQRYGAWAQLLSLFRLIHDGARYSSGGHGATFKLPPRQGHLFNPDRYPFLEGRPYQSTRQVCETIQPPMVSDGIVFRVLQNLLILDGERLSYRTLDVEQIGSVYETVMGFTLEVAKGRSIAIKPTKLHGAPVTINLDELLATKPGDRAKWVKDNSDQSITGESLRALQDAATPEDLVAALGKKASPTTPRIVPPEAMVLQPSDERRRSGSHYTPRSLTEPIVRTTLRPVLEQLSDRPTPEQILALKVCDPAMGSGAFLVEADRQLADELVKAWHNHNCVPAIPPDEDEVLFARRLVAQRCLYGVDRNHMAVDLAKLALWLATLAKDHAFTFVDHALRCGDSLVGLTRKQIAAFHWQPTKYVGEIEHLITERLRQAMELRAEIQSADESVNETTLRLMLKDSQESLDVVRTIGDLVVAAFFSSEKPKERENKRSEYLTDLTHALSGGGELPETALHSQNAGLQSPNVSLQTPKGSLQSPNVSLQSPSVSLESLISGAQDAVRLCPFHWEVEFPEVFTGQNPGFDAIIGNPPFLWGNRISTVLGTGYRNWLLTTHDASNGNADYVVYFLRRALQVLCIKGCFGFITTNSISETDTKSAGLDYILSQQNTIFAATANSRWLGEATVRVSTVHILKGGALTPCYLDGVEVEVIGPDLRQGYLASSCSQRVEQLVANTGKAFKGVDFGGAGFLLCDEEYAELTRCHQDELRYVQPVLNAEDLTESPAGRPSRHIINFAGVDLETASRAPFCMKFVEERVKPMREKKSGREKEIWWQFRRTGEAYLLATARLSHVMVNPVVSKYISFFFSPPEMVFTNAVNVFALANWQDFCVLQSRVHEWWALRNASTLRIDPRYNPSDCFETFPFPKDFETNPALESAGQEYYEFRAALMVRNNEGLTKTYNRFHDPEEQSPDILRLRELHAAMDRVVLDAYGWTDLHPTCEFLLDYEEEEDEDETPTRGRSPGSRGRKKPWRYRWPDDFRDEVLARLLELNRQYAEAERLSGAAAEKKPKRNTGKGLKKVTNTGQCDLSLE